MRKQSCSPKPRHAERGSLMVSVILMVLVLGMLGACALAVSYRTYTMQRKMAGYQQAYYTAEASAQLTLDAMQSACQQAWAQGAVEEEALLEAVATVPVAVQPEFDAETVAELEQASVRVVNGRTGLFVRIRGRYGGADRVAEGFLPYAASGFGMAQVAEKLH